MKQLKRILLILIVIAVGYGVSYVWRALPILTGYGAKMMCSCTMVAGRNEADVFKNELGTFPLSKGTFHADYTDSSATGSVLGLAKQKAIYRKGLGCTLLSEMSEEDLRSQKFIVTSPPLVNQDTIMWPLGNKLPDTLPTGVNYEKIKAVLDEAFSEPGSNKRRRTRSIIIVHDGNIIAERYADGFNQHSKQIGWSISKSLTNALLGILVKQGKLQRDKPAPVEAWQNDERKKITLGNLMHMSSGLRWEENYGGPSDATNMLYKEKDMGGFAASAPFNVLPETEFKYSSGTSNILSLIIRNTVGDAHYHSFPATELFYKIGAYSMVMEPDPSGTFVGSSYAFGTARDWARFGLLYSNNGNWNGEQIFSKEWVTYTTTPAPAAPRGEYGAQFWLNAGAKDNPSNRYYPDVPTDLYWADGYEGQNIFIIPSKKLVVVKLSLSQGEYLDDNAFLSGIIEALK